MRPRRWLPNWGASWLDLKLGPRMLVKYPGLTLVAVFALAIRIPVELLPTHFINSVTRPLPVPDADGIVTLQNRDLVEADPLRRPLHDLVQWREDLTSYEAPRHGTLGPLQRHFRRRPIQVTAAHYRRIGDFDAHVGARVSASRHNEQRPITEVDLGKASSADEFHFVPSSTSVGAFPFRSIIVSRVKPVASMTSSALSAAPRRPPVWSPWWVGDDDVRGHSSGQAHRLLRHPEGSLVGCEALDDDDAGPTRDDPTVAERRAILEWVGHQGPDTVGDLLDPTPRLRRHYREALLPRAQTTHSQR
jgi:hypothetical protein